MTESKIIWERSDRDEGTRKVLAFHFGHGTKRTLHPTPLKGHQENILFLLRDTNHQYFLLS